MSKPSEELIFDRTQQDVDDETLKAIPGPNVNYGNLVQISCR